MMHVKQKQKVLIAYNLPPDNGDPDDPDAISEKAVVGEATAVHTTLRRSGHTTLLLPLFHLDQALDQIHTFQPNVIFNLCEGFRGNARHESHIAGIWELLNIPYTGNSAFTLGLSQDKALSKKLFDYSAIPTPSYRVFDRIPEDTDLIYPLIAKPSREDASLGITQDSVIIDAAALRRVVSNLLRKYRQPVLVEQLISGREFNISILGNTPPQVLPVSEIDFSGLEKHQFAITSYEAKWLPDHVMYQKTPAICPAKISAGLRQRLEDTALAVYRALGGRDYGRVDVRCDADENIYVLEYNPNPDISPDAGFVRSLCAAGISYDFFVEFLLSESLKRKNNDSHSQIN